MLSKADDTTGSRLSFNDMGRKATAGKRGLILDFKFWILDISIRNPQSQIPNPPAFPGDRLCCLSSGCFYDLRLHRAKIMKSAMARNSNDLFFTLRFSV